MQGLTIGIVFSYEPVEQLARCIESLHKEVPELRKIVSEIHWVLVRTPKSQGKEVSFFPGSEIWSSTENLAINRNLALQAAKGDGFYFIDPDCWLQPGSLVKLCQTFEAHQSNSEIFAFAGSNSLKSKNQNLEKSLQWLSQTRWLHGGSAQIEKFNSERRDWHSPTCNILYDRNIIRGENFSPAFSKVGEDLEMHFRIHQKLGKKVLLCQQASVWHEQPSEIWQYLRKVFKYGSAQTLLLRAHPQSVINHRLWLLIFSILWAAVMAALPSYFVSSYLVATFLIGFAVLTFEVLNFKGEKRLIANSGFFLLIISAYFLGQISGLLVPRTKSKSV